MNKVIPLVRSGRLPGHTVARLIGIDEAGRPLVRHPWHAEPVVARTSVALGRDAALVGREVLIVFVDDDPLAPIVTGLVANSVDDEGFERLRTVEVGQRLQMERLEFDATEQVSIRCGKSQILMDRFGKIVIKGCDILTRASSRNRIKGGSVGIN